MSNDTDESEEEGDDSKGNTKRAKFIAALEKWETVPWREATPWCHIMDHFPGLTELSIDLEHRVKPQDHALLCSQVNTWRLHSSLQTIWLYCSVPDTKTGPGLCNGRFRYHQVGEQWTLDTSESYDIQDSGRDWVELPKGDYFWYSGYR